MSFLRGLLWFVFAIALIAVAIYAAGGYEASDRLTGLFLQIQPYLPLTLNFDQFLVVLAVLSLVVVFLVLAGCASLLVLMSGWLSIAKQRELAQGAAAKKEVGHIKDQHVREYSQLLSVAQALARRLDKRVLVQGIVEAASKSTSVPQANSVASCWLLHFETDTIRFDAGMYCDESLFAKTIFQPTEQPFARIIGTQKPWVLPKWEQDLPFIKPEKVKELGAAASALVIPLVVEGGVLGILLLLCHPDVVKSYREQEPFYNAFWGELALALAIAVQGEVAILDRLTGVHNREYFSKRLVQELERANRYQLPLSLLMIDIDNFKAVNDTLGHPQGDAVLKIIAKIIKKEVRAIDLVGRYGGEEFIIMLPETGYGDETSSAAGALVVAERIRKSVDEEFHGMQKPLNLSVSVGVAVRRYPEDRDWDYRELVRLADEQLYRAKTGGKNKVCVVTPQKAQQVT